MQYKNRIIDLVRHHLLLTHKSTDVDKMLGGWNYQSKKDDRNEVIEKSLLEIKEILTASKLDK